MIKFNRRVKREKNKTNKTYFKILAHEKNQLPKLVDEMGMLK
jgi:hypothetical protein